MKMLVFRGCLALAAMATAAGSLRAARAAQGGRAATTPVTKVLEMLKDMKAKGQATMLTEQKTYAVYKEWVRNTSKDLNFSISTAERQLEELNAYIPKATADVHKLDMSIGKLNITIDNLGKAVRLATDERKEEHATFTAQDKDQSESVDALERAIAVLKSQAPSTEATALLQRVRETVPGVAGVLAELSSGEGKAMGAPDVAAYEFQSGGVVGLLEGLLVKFKEQHAELVAVETKRRHYHEMDVSHKQQLIEQYTKDRVAETGMKASTQESLLTAKDDKVGTYAALSDDKEVLIDTTNTFRAKTLAYMGNQKVRAEELEALDKAIEIIGSPAVAESYREHVKLAQLAPPAAQPAPSAATSFLQLRRSGRGTGRGSSLRERAAELLASKSRALGSRGLEAIADAAAAADPLGKVIVMIEDLLDRLQEEARLEADHTSWCDEQVSKTRDAINGHEETISVAKADAQVLNNTIAQQTADISELSAGQAQLTAAMAEAASQRAKEKEANEHAISDAKEGIAAVIRAIEILDSFYNVEEVPAAEEAPIKGTGGATLLQQVPEMEAYGGQFSDGVMEMLRVIRTDLERLEASTSAAEEAAAADFADFMEESKEDVETKQTQEFELKVKKDEKEFELSQTKKTIAAEQAELDAANAYFEQLRPSCLEVHVDYKARVAKREEEIQALKQAYDILDSKSSE